ncbi:hypothetical protein [Methylocapsa acidiphila]|uniref:hypothetical protein n=1 Tax=Methylocapsa acidiphila TaxID=133552 RepID=UPI0003FC9906|nr:hypothetical protein [Methylocapsa acidiphila]
MRVFEGGQPGYAILVFDREMESPSLSLAVRSMQVAQGAYLGPSGAFEREPHYFNAVRVAAPKGGFGYQVGPDVVNHLMEDDQIEVSAEDVGLVETGYWANATPLMTSGRAATLTLLAGARSPPLVSQPAARGADETPKPEPKPPTGQAAPQKADEIKIDDQTLEREAEAKAEQKDGREAAPRERWRWYAAGGLALILAAAAGGLTLSRDLRCSILVRDCPPPAIPKLDPAHQPVEPEDKEAARQAQECDSSETAAGLVCDEDMACFEPYRRRFPQGPARAELEGLANKAAAACAAESQAFLRARQCAAAAAACVAPTCYVDYTQKFANGVHAQQARDDLNQARIRCENLTPSPDSDHLRRSGPPPLKDGEYLAIASESAACGMTRQRAIHVSVCSGRIRWVHEGRLSAGMPPVTMQWEGAMDGAGTVVASVGGNAQLVANGRVTETERAIQMQYPGCGEAISLTITRELSSGCAGR